MSVERISIQGLRKLLKGQVKEDATCMVKFYSNGCHYCDNLKSYYHDISENEEFNKVHFFAFNIDDFPAIEKQLSFNGVPTIFIIKTTANGNGIKLRSLSEPSEPNPETWYRSADIINFIKQEL